MGRAGIRARALALLPLGAYTVHQGRYLIVPGSERADAHGYLAAAPLAVALLLALALARRLERAARASSGVPPRPSSAAWSSTALLGIYVAQELAEALTTSGAPLPFAAGGWVSIPLALVIGGLISLALRVDAAADQVLGTAMRVAIRPGSAAAPWHGAGAALHVRPRCGPLARCAAERAPPALA
jgi:hypothetical protein